MAKFRSNRVLRAARLVFGGVVLLSLGSRASAATPLEVVKGTNEAVLSTYSKHRAIDAAVEKELFATIDSVTDYQALAAGAIEPLCPKLTAAQCTSFKEIFTRLLRVSSIKKLGRYRADRFEYGTEQVTGESAVVKSIAIFNEERVPLDYHLARRSDSWVIVNYVVDDVDTVPQLPQAVRAAPGEEELRSGHGSARAQDRFPGGREVAVSVLDSGAAVIKRRKFVIERGAQSRVALWVVLHLGVCLALTLLLVLLPTLLRFFRGGGELPRALEASREFVFLDGPLAAALAAMLVAVVVNSFTLTHRIFGPLVRLKRVLRRWREEGTWPAAFHVRRRDFHAELFEEVGAAVAAVSGDVAAAREKVRRAGDRARSIGARLGPGEDGDGVRAIAEECRQALDRLERWSSR